MPRLLCALAALLVGCGPVTAYIGDGLAPGDTAAGDTAAGDTAAADTADSGDDGWPDGPLIWNGTRTMVFNFGCEDRVSGEGVEVTTDPAHAEAIDACAGCDHLFLVTMDRRSVCEIGVASPVYRGLTFDGDDQVILYQLPNRGGLLGQEELARGSWSLDEATGVGQVDYDYVYSGGRVRAEVEGTVTLE